MTHLSFCVGLNRAAFFLILCVGLPSGMIAQTQGQAKRPSITGIDHVTLYVSDLQKSREFYSQDLGLASGCAREAESEDCFQVLPSGQRVFLQAAPSGSKDGTVKNWVAEIGFETADLGKMRRYLQAHGIKAGTVQSLSDNAKSFQVTDPEGNSIAFVQRPARREGRPSARQVGSRLIHAGFVVKDMAAENHFYVDLLGFRLYWYGGFKEDKTDWYEIQVPDGPDWIEYMLNISPTADHKEFGIQNHFSLGVKDVHAAATQLHANGLKSFDGPEVGRDGKDSLDAYDPDATRVEVMNFRPSQKPCCHPYTAEHPKE
jgi:catechol 2,3-dioxygenase-like lactoylglutathione lyase family enzyme